MVCLGIGRGKGMGCDGELWWVPTLLYVAILVSIKKQAKNIPLINAAAANWLLLGPF